MSTKSSARELLVAQLIAQGLSNRQIASQLNISHDTARRYSSRLHRQLGERNLAALACVQLPPGAATLRAIPALAATISASEMAVLDLMCQGCTTKRIARQLAISPRTVDKHRQRILRKTGQQSIRMLTAWVAQQYALCGIAAREPVL